MITKGVDLIVYPLFLLNSFSARAASRKAQGMEHGVYFEY